LGGSPTRKGGNTLAATSQLMVASQNKITIKLNERVPMLAICRM
jgi:hypothetical protein